MVTYDDLLLLNLSNILIWIKKIKQEKYFFGKSSTVRRLKRSHMTAINQVVHRPDREKGPSLPKLSDGHVFENS